MAKKRRHNRILTPEQKASTWMTKNLEDYMTMMGEVRQVELARAAAEKYNLLDEGDIPEFLINQASVITERYFK